MDEFHGHASVRVDAPPRAVFDFITDPARLPEWNAAIEIPNSLAAMASVVSAR